MFGNRQQKMRKDNRLTVKPRKNIMKCKKTWIISCALLLLLTGASSCDSKTLLYQFCPIPQQIWNKTDTMDIPFPKLSHDTVAQVLLCIRNKNRLERKDLWVVVEYAFRNPDFQRRDTVHCQLSDSLGQPNGQGMNHIVSEHEAGLLHYRKGQKGKFRLYHIMRSEDIAGITDVGLHLIAAPDSARHQYGEK